MNSPYVLTIANAILTEKNRVGGLKLPNSQTSYKATIIKTKQGTVGERIDTSVGQHEESIYGCVEA